eukprot:1139902-Pelagomonas_calceolata.AAC.6
MNPSSGEATTPFACPRGLKQGAAEAGLVPTLRIDRCTPMGTHNIHTQTHTYTHAVWKALASTYALKRAAAAIPWDQHPASMTDHGTDAKVQFAFETNESFMRSWLLQAPRRLQSIDVLTRSKSTSLYILNLPHFCQSIGG